jgi:predicted nuclease of predicted toxin-antitoxin system
MRLLFDQNLSHRLVSDLEDLSPNSAHVRLLGLSEADDLTIWN